MARVTKPQLKEKYSALLRKEKEIIGQALVKVNLGVALPQDQRRIAEFLKGSSFIAKSGQLEELIHILHSDKDISEPPTKGKTPTSKEEMQDQDPYEEDSVITAKELDRHFK